MMYLWFDDDTSYEFYTEGGEAIFTTKNLKYGRIECIGEDRKQNNEHYSIFDAYIDKQSGQIVRTPCGEMW